ncbi:hypothetical protein [Nocardia thraciensis]
MTVSGDLTEQAERIADSLREAAAPGWQRLEAWFAMTVVAEAALLTADDGARSVRCRVPDAVWEAVRRHRQISVLSDAGPWWRLLVRIDAAGAEVVADHGAEPFPGEQLFAPDAYLADLDAHPRERLPVWLAAYVGRGEPQSRPPRRAAERMRADGLAGVRATVVQDELPDLSVLWARWAVLSAAFVAVGSARGPRMAPAVGLFESAARSGSTLAVLPGDRAVLSGGVWNAPILEAVYNDDAAMPDFFAGAPDWVADPVLNPRVSSGLLTFCYWWEAGRWFRGESAPMMECAPALPAVWTVDSVAGVVGRLVDGGAGGTSEAVEFLVSAAQAGTVTREAVVRACGDHGRADVDSALFQFTVAGVAAHEDTITEVAAIDLVRDHIRRAGSDTTGYPLSALTAERLGVGWMVSAPMRDDEIAVDRAVFYVADDGVVERSSTSVPTSSYTDGFAQRFRLRRDGRA